MIRNRIIGLCLASALTASAWAVQNCLSLDGNGDYVAIPNAPSLSGGASWTIEAWIYPITNLGHQPIVAKDPPGNFQTSDYTLSIGDYPGHNIVLPRHFGVEIDQAAGRVAISSSAEVLVGIWTHAAFTISPPNVVRLYINGELDGVLYTPQPIVVNSNDGVGIGAYDHGDKFFSGRIDEVRIWRTTLSEDEINLGFYCELEGTEEGLAGYWPLNETSGSVVYDHSPNGNSGTLYGNAQFVLSTSPLNRPRLTITLAQQRPQPSLLVDIWYDLTHCTDLPMAVTLQASSNGGVSWNIPATTVHGDAGSDIHTGSAKHVIWNAGADWPGMLSDSMKVRIIANDE